MNIRIIIFLLGAGLVSAQVPLSDTADESVESRDASSVFAQDETTLSFADDTAADVAATSGGIGSAIRMIFILVLVVAVLYGLVVLLKRAKKGRFQTPMIRVLGTQSIGNNRLLYVVQLGEQVFFLSASEAGLHLLTEITDQETLDYVRVQSEQRPAQPFSQLLAGVVSSFSDNKSLSRQMEGLRARSERLGRL